MAALRGTAVNTDPRQTIANSPMSWLQIVAIALTIALNGLDGFDVQGTLTISNQATF
jgi:hypothetical protein